MTRFTDIDAAIEEAVFLLGEEKQHHGVMQHGNEMVVVRDYHNRPRRWMWTTRGKMGKMRAGTPLRG